MLQIARHGLVAEIRMDRPPANGLTFELVSRLTEALDEVRVDGARAIVLNGRPGMFSGGLDVPALIGLDRDRIEAFWRSFFLLNRRLAGSAIPVIAAISGHAPAGGAVLALHCDQRIAADGRFKIGLNEVQVGLPVPRTILAALEFAVGARQAGLLAIQGALISVQEAHRIGLVDELVPAEALLETCLRRANEWLALPSEAMNTTRLAVKSRLLDALGEADDAAAATAWWFSAETQAGMRALVARLTKA